GRVLRQRPLARDRLHARVERVAERRRERRALVRARLREARRDREGDGPRLQARVLLERLLVALLDRTARLRDDVDELLRGLTRRLVVDRPDLAGLRRAHRQRGPLDRDHDLALGALLAQEARVLVLERLAELLLLGLRGEAGV